MDYIKQKQKQADTISENTKAAERFVTATIAGLERANSQIEQQIKELDEHRIRLNEICSKLMLMQAKNNLLIEKFQQIQQRTQP
ncbi:MAG TPA: hypothetical protein DD391_07420 [Clostridiales bacterium]|jgi:hypothetical protein|nr:hypothetical protein [Clostridiales bacterium]HBL82409.1 hypothetical protein [Clostridiales bacterium]